MGERFLGRGKARDVHDLAVGLEEDILPRRNGPPAEHAPYVVAHAPLPANARSMNATRPHCQGRAMTLAMGSRLNDHRVGWPGIPLRNKIEARDASLLEDSTDTAAEAIARRFSRIDVDGKIQAHVFSIGR
jgi:hypothetical protein